MKISMPADIRSDARLRFDAPPPVQGDVPESASEVRFTMAGRFSGRARTFNKAQWTGFRAAMLSSPDVKAGRVTPDQVDTIFSTYNTKRRLTPSKVRNILDDVRNAATGRSPVARRPDRLNASQSGIARLWNTVVSFCRGNKAEAAALLRKQQASETTRLAIANVLRPARTIGNSTIQEGQSALKARNDAEGKAHLEVSIRGYDRNYTLAERLEGLTKPYESYLESEKGLDRRIEALKAKASVDDGKPVLLSFPNGLYTRGGNGFEDHSVAIVADFRKKAILYLDPKGTPLEKASEVYRQGDIRKALNDFGRELFGADWVEDEGILQLTQAKQQGANDCGALTHAFTRMVIGGMSVGDIERGMTDADLRNVRLQMAKDIDAWSAGPASQPPAQAVVPDDAELI
jgi:hypothetical protein